MELDINRLAEIAGRAGEAIMEIYHGDEGKWDVDHKADDSPLTKADREANRIICEALVEWTPHIPIISEENKLASYATRQVRGARTRPGWAPEAARWAARYLPRVAADWAHVGRTAASSRRHGLVPGPEQQACLVGCVCRASSARTMSGFRHER